VNRLFVSFLFIFILKFNFGYSQYTEIINSNRPGSSSGAFSVGKNILQFENGFYYTNEEHQLLNYKVKGFGADFKIRYGFLLDKLELVIDGVFQADNFTDNRYSPSNSFDRKNFKKFKIGAKYLVYDPKKGQVDKPNLYSYWANKKFKWKNLIPAVSTYIGINFDSENNPYTNSNLSGISPSAAIFTQSNITNRSVITTNLIFERIGSSQNDLEYIISLTHAFSENMIGFIETHGIKSDFYAENKMNLGVAYLFSNNLQIDISATVNFKDTPQIFNGGLGLSYRRNLNKTK
tara:strand:- start:1500 stop:2372 length:873 start_codon:yes stop_codon:yes gene_type:complete